MIETWRPITGYEGLYDVSDYGRVRSRRNGKVMANVTVTDGYQGVKLYRAGQAKSCLIHRLVCAAFNGPAPDGYQAAHLDGNKLNNCAGNLAWRTPKANTADKRAHGTHQAGEKHPRAKLSVEQVAEIRASTVPSPALAGVYGVHQSTIRNIRQGVRWCEASQSGPNDSEGNAQT